MKLSGIREFFLAKTTCPRATFFRQYKSYELKKNPSRVEVIFQASKRQCPIDAGHFVVGFFFFFFLSLFFYLEFLSLIWISFETIELKRVLDTLETPERTASRKSSRDACVPARVNKPTVPISLEPASWNICWAPNTLLSFYFLFSFYIFKRKKVHAPRLNHLGQNKNENLVYPGTSPAKHTQTGTD